MNRWVGLGLVLITAGAWALRGPQLDLRPMHNDEAVNAIKIKDLWEHRRHAYDPDEYHGPTLHYATLPFIWLSGAPDFDRLTETTLRAVAVFFGLIFILLLWLMADGLGRVATIIAGILAAISPAMVFYSRYFIHEMLLVCFTMLAFAAGWRYTQTRCPGWAALTGVGLGLMYATKETFVLAVAAMVLALGLMAAWNRWRDDEVTDLRSFWNWRHALIALAAAGVVGTVLFTSFFTNASGPIDSVRTYLPWLKRAGGDSPHIHPWYFFLERLAFFKEPRGTTISSEGLILVLALVGALVAFSRRGMTGANVSLARFLAFYTIILTFIYSAIPYKTPWCMLGFLHGMILLAGIGAVTLIRMCRWRPLQAAAGILLLVAAAQLTWQAWRASHILPAHRGNPYAYAQTVPDVLGLVERVHALAAVHPEKYQMVIKVMAPESDYWPLPWYLRQFRRVGWWGQIPSDPYAPVMIVGANFNAAFDDHSDREWLMVGYSALRRATFVELYVQFELWREHVERMPRPLDEH
jgi:uncharacterized protein (TIGR03663 family)